VSDENSWYRRMDLDAKVVDEVGFIVRKFHEKRIEIGGAPAPREQGFRGVGFMYAEGQFLARERHLEQIREIAAQYSFRALVDRRVIGDIFLVKLIFDDDKETPESNEESAESNSEAAAGDAESTEGNGETHGGNGETHGGYGGHPDEERSPVLFLLNRIDEQLGVGIATPDQVLTVAHMSPCSATEPQAVYGPKEPFPPRCEGDGGEGVRIWIADTGLVEDADKDYRWLKGVRSQLDPRTGSDDAPNPYFGHGTFVAGVLRCLAPKADIYVANIFDIAGSSLESDFVTNLNESFDFAFEILHLTAACPSRKNVQLIALEAWLKLLRPFKGVAVVAPAGNHPTRRPNWPGALPGVISVGALASNWTDRAWFSNYGGWVDVYAPGQNLVNAYPTGTYTCDVYPHKGEKREIEGLAQWSGTSFSAPIVTGLIATRMACRGESASEAVAALLARARTQTVPSVGPVLLPSCDCCCCDSDEGGQCDDSREAGCRRDHSRCGGHRGASRGGRPR
jgi:hypothetical protein